MNGKSAAAVQRFTPTLVGKTEMRYHLVGMLPVHPHACGENIIQATPPPALEGSPPRLWGKHI